MTTSRNDLWSYPLTVIVITGLVPAIQPFDEFTLDYPNQSGNDNSVFLRRGNHFAIGMPGGVAHNGEDKH